MMASQATSAPPTGTAASAFPISLRLMGRFRPGRMCPIRTTSALGMSRPKKSTGRNASRSDTPAFIAYSSKIGATFGKSYPVHRPISLRRPDIDEAAAVLPGKGVGDGHVGAGSDTRHRAEEILQS